MSAVPNSDPSAPPFLQIEQAAAPTERTARAGAAVARNELIDVVRLIAAAGIVFIHAARSEALDPWRNLFRFAVPFYLCASLYYQSWSMRRKPRTLVEFVRGRFNRLYVPFLAWSLIYLLAREAKQILFEHHGPVSLDVGMLWRGTQYHLWFLPFLFFWSIFLALVYSTILSKDRRWRWPLIALAIAAGFVFTALPMPKTWNETFDNPTYGYVQFWLSMPALCWAMAFAWFMTMGPALYTSSSAVGVAGIVIAVFFSAWQVVKGIQLIPRALTGVGCMLAALAPWHGKILSVLARYGRNAYGIYLCHVLIGEFVRVVGDRLHFGTSPQMDIVIFAISMIGSVTLVQLLARSRYTAWLNG